MMSTQIPLFNKKAPTAGHRAKDGHRPADLARSMTMLTGTRLLETPTSYDAASRTVNAILSVGSPVERPYGVEILKISPSAIDLARVYGAGGGNANSSYSANVGALPIRYLEPRRPGPILFPESCISPISFTHPIADSRSARFAPLTPRRIIRSAFFNPIQPALRTASTIAFRSCSICTVNVTMSGGLVSQINYLGPTGGLLTKGEQCAFAVERCAQ